MIVTEEQLEKIFAEAKGQEDYIIALYKLAVPDWDRVKKVDGFPSAGVQLTKQIFKKAMEFDNRVHNKPLPPHQHIFPGGAWMNWGFRQDETLDPWELSTEGVNIIYEDQGSRNGSN